MFISSAFSYVLAFTWLGVQYHLLGGECTVGVGPAGPVPVVSVTPPVPSPCCHRPAARSPRSSLFRVCGGGRAACRDWQPEARILDRAWRVPPLAAAAAPRIGGILDRQLAWRGAGRMGGRWSGGQNGEMGVRGRRPRASSAGLCSQFSGNLQPIQRD